MSYPAALWLPLISVAPEHLELIGREVRVARRVDDILVPEVVLNRPHVLPVVGQLVTRRVSQRVRVDRERRGAAAPARATIFRTPESVSGPPRSVVNT